MGSRQSNLQAEVCVVGAGPAGLAVATALVRRGRQVALLESGDGRGGIAAQQLNDGDVEGEPYHGLKRTRHRQLGGTAGIWNTPVRGRSGGKFVPLGLGDLVTWPIGWPELEAYYVAAQALCGLGPFEYDAGFWASADRQPFALDGTGLTSAVYQLGAAAPFTSELPAELRASEGCELIPSATVMGLDWGPGTGTLGAIRAIRGDGTALTVRSRVTVLACGAVENARLLLVSDRGPGQALRWLGRGFMEHPRDYSPVLAPFDRALFTRAGFYDVQERPDGSLAAGRIGVTDEAIRSLALPNASVTLLPRPRSGSGQGVLHRLVRRIHRIMGVEWAGGYGWYRPGALEDRFDAFNLVLNLEQRPAYENRVGLSRRRDRFGNPLPRLYLRWSQEEQAGLDRLRMQLGEWLQAAGLGRLESTGGVRPDMNAHHHAGTTRMGTGPEDGVVDSRGRLFGTDNVYFAGASVFPTAGFANPALTVVALSLRLADHLGASL